MSNRELTTPFDGAIDLPVRNGWYPCVLKGGVYHAQPASKWPRRYWNGTHFSQPCCAEWSDENALFIKGSRAAFENRELQWCGLTAPSNNQGAEQMTTELTKAAQQALEALKLCYDVVEYPANGTSRQDKAIAALERALTQRPAAQTERDILNDSAWIAGAKFGWNCGVEGTRDLLNQCIEQRIKDRVEARASLPAPQRATPATPEDMKVYDGIAAGYFADTQQATPEPLTLGPLAKRNIYDAIRGAYDLGYNDARNARTVPGDSAPGYDGRSVEEDHGGALFNLLSKRLTPATPEPLIVKGAMAGMVDAQVRDLWPTKGATPEPVGSRCRPASKPRCATTPRRTSSG